jgi:DNA-binding response OmpR family regulator
LNRSRLAWIRHELRTPLNHVIGYAEMIMEELPPGEFDQFRRDLGAIHAAGLDLLGLVNERLSEAAVRARKVDLAALHSQVRTRLTEVIGYSEILQEDAPGQGLGEFGPDLAKIATAGKSLLALANEVLAPDELDAPSLESEPEAAGREPRPLAANGVVLVVDDDVANRDLLARRLGRLGYTVRTAEDGAAALAEAEAGGPDVVLLDMVMPGMDGLEVLESLKASAGSKDIPVIMLSGMDSMETIGRCIELGAEDYLSKPFEPVLLRARIGASLEKKRLRDQEVEYLQQVEHLTAAASAVENGTSVAAHLEKVTPRQDALGNLARVFQSMVEEVRAREQRLRQQVETLRVEIDHVRKAREVQEITETESFRDLQSRARSLRTRPPRRPAPGTNQAPD